MIECKIPLTDGTHEGFSIGKTLLQIQWINQENRTPTGRAVYLELEFRNLEIVESQNNVTSNEWFFFSNLALA